MVRNSLVFFTLFLVIACGADGGGDAAVDDPTHSASNRSPTVTNSMFNDFSFDYSGNVEILSEWAHESMTLTGGCRSDEGIGLMFQDNSGIGRSSWFMVSAESKVSPGSGKTGTFPVEKVQWFNGQRKDPEMGMMLPTVLEGSGTLTVTEHRGRGMAGRMAGTLEADLAHKDRDENASIELHFDINYACAG